MEKKQASIEWFNDCVFSHLREDQKPHIKGLFEQAKEMYLNEIEKAYLEGLQDCQRYFKKQFGGQDNE